MAVTAAPFFLRPRTILQEIDATQIVTTPTGTTAFINGEFRRGSLTPSYVGGSSDRFFKNYGEMSDPTLSYAHDTAVSFLASKGQLLVNRVVPDNAKHAFLDVFLDEDAVYGDRMLFIPSVSGRTAGYEGGSSGISLLKFSAQFVVGNTFTLNLSDGTVANLVSQPFAVNHATTLQNIATDITTKLATFGTGGYAEVYVEPSSVTAVSYTIIIHPPIDATVIVSGPVVAGGTTQPVPSILEADDNWLMTIPAENPGVWAGDVGVRLNQLDQGVRERYRLTFNQALVAGNSFNMNVNGIGIIAVPFNTNNDTTMADIAASLTLHPNVRAAFVEETIGSVNNDRTIIIVAEEPGPNYLTITSPVVTGGAVQAVVTFARSLTGKASNGSMVLEVFKRSAPNYPIERFTFTTFPSRNGRGEQTQYTSQINIGASPSYNVRMIVNPALHTETGFAPILTKMLDANFQFRSTIAYLGGGDDGSAVLTSQLISALSKFEDRIHYPVNMLLNAGYTAVEYQKALTSLAELRNDCTAILDMPTDRQGTAQSARDYRLYDLDIASSHAAIYTPDILISDITTGEHRYIPPSGMVAAAYVYSDSVGARWSAPAGLRRGKLRQALGFRVTYTTTDEELLHPQPVGVNCLVDRPVVGPVIMGEQTLLGENSALASVHIRRLMNLIETTLVDGLDYTMFEPHTEATRYAVLQLGESVLSPIHRREGLYEYWQQCDDGNNTPDIIDADALAYDVYVKPVRAIKGILLRAIITRTGTSFSVISAQMNGTAN